MIVFVDLPVELFCLFRLLLLVIQKHYVPYQNQKKNLHKTKLHVKVENNQQN